MPYPQSLPYQPATGDTVMFDPFSFLDEDSDNVLVPRTFVPESLLGVDTMLDRWSLRLEMDHSAEFMVEPPHEELEQVKKQGLQDQHQKHKQTQPEKADSGKNTGNLKSSGNSSPRNWMPCGDWGWMFVDWALGLGSKDRFYSGFSDQTEQIRRLPPIQKALDAYKLKNTVELNNASCDIKNLQSLTDYKVSFNIPRVWWATRHGSCSWHFVGSFAVNIYPVSCRRVRFEVKNKSSFTSFSYGIGPHWGEGPMSDIDQTYTWEQDL